VSLLNLAQDRVRLAEQAEQKDQYRLAGYRAKAWECLPLAESVNDPERRADLLLSARMRLGLTEPIKDELRGALSCRLGWRPSLRSSSPGRTVGLQQHSRCSLQVDQGRVARGMLFDLEIKLSEF
jgi:hypothetical protein